MRWKVAVPPPPTTMPSSAIGPAAKEVTTEGLVSSASSIKAAVGMVVLSQHESSLQMLAFMRKLAKCKIDSMSLQNELVCVTRTAAENARYVARASEWLLGLLTLPRRTQPAWVPRRRPTRATLVLGPTHISNPDVIKGPLRLRVCVCGFLFCVVQRASIKGCAGTTREACPARRVGKRLRQGRT